MARLALGLGLAVVALAACRPAPPPAAPPSEVAPDAPSAEVASASSDEHAPPPSEPAPTRSEPPPRDPVAESTFVLLISSKRARTLPHADAVCDLFAPLPDYTLLIDQAGLDVMHDFDHILAATPNFRDFRRTFLVGEYTLSREDMIAALERGVRRSGQKIEWVEHLGFVGGNPVPQNAGIPDDDPRWFVLLPNEPVGVYVPPEFLGSIVPRGEGDPKLDHVATLRRLIAQRPDAGLQFEVSELTQRLRGWNLREPGLPFEALEGIRIAVDATVDPDFAVTLTFRDETAASQMEHYWREELPKRIDQLDLAVKILVKPLADQVMVDRDGASFVARAQLTNAQLTWLIGVLSDAALSVSSKDDAEIDRLRRQRADNWARRKQGRLPPAALDPKPPGG